MKANDKIVKCINDIKNGHEEAFADLYEESYKYLHTCVIHIVKDEEAAQDMLQDTYVEIYKNIGQLKDAENFLGWSAAIANRKCFAYIKKRKDILVEEQTDDDGNTTNYFENIADDEAFIPENIFDNREKINIIRGIIDDLTDVQRACVIGFYYNEQKQEKIAEELGIPVNTVKSHLNRAKAKIKEATSDIEKKQGIRLLAVIPFMAALFGFETETYAAELAVPAMSAALVGNTISNSMTSAGVTATKTVAKAATKATSKTVGAALKTKIAIGATAAALGVGAATGAVLINKPSEPAYVQQEIREEETETKHENAKPEKVEEPAKEEPKRIPLLWENLYVPGETGYTIEGNSTSVSEYEGEIYRSEWIYKIMFDGTKYIEEYYDCSMEGFVIYYDLENRIDAIYDPDGAEWDIDSSELDGYKDLEEKTELCFNNLKDNIWEYVGEENGTLIYSSTGGKTIHNDFYVYDEPDYVQERYYDAVQTIYVNPDTNELIKIQEKYSDDFITYNYDDYGNIIDVCEVSTYMCEDEYLISNIGSTGPLSAPDGL